MTMRGSVVISLCILIQLSLQNTTVKAEDGPVLQTKSGALKGEYIKAKGKDTVVHSYLGVPFAKPPVGPLRFSPPQPAEKWSGVRDATKQPFMCLQDKQLLEVLVANMSMSVEVPDSSEDCLYLNVYTPSKPGANDKLPVMVWIHGGGFSMASASVFDGHVLAAYQDVVVVLIQYRLGLLGFFSTGDEHAPGNYGLLDQVAALQWVQENIHSFGGDPGSVTIFGESAGGVSVSLHYVGNVSGCEISCTKKIVDCVMQMSEDDILTLVKEHPVLRFGVTVDGRFLPKPAAELLQSQQFNKVPLITGITDDECGFMLPNFMSPEGWTEGMDMEQILPVLTMFNPAFLDQSVAELVLNEYLGTSPDRINIRDGFREMLGDFLFNIPARTVANYHRNAGAPVYAYEFQHPPSVLQKKRPSFAGSDHGDEVLFVFGFCFAIGPINIKGPVLQTKSGALKGEYIKAKGKDTVVHSYLGVPFAKPPVGPLRFSPPQPAEKWSGVRDATKQPFMCLQDKQLVEVLVANLSLNVEVPDSSEDCLYLNVYTPSKPGANDKLPVMVWIHGGGFSMASASVFDGHVLAAYQDVVVVLIQYRLGLLGFFSTGDEHAPGNYGLLDQVAALQWVQENIHSFGGDPGLVTIFGESAGGVSVSLHYVGNVSGCEISCTKKIVDCVMQMSEDDILTLVKEHPVLRFGVTVDGRFLPKPAAELLQSQQFNKVPLITGITDDECGFMLPNFMSPEGWTEGMDMEQILPLLTMFNPAFLDQSVAELVLNEYLGTSPDRINIRDGFREMLGDFLFNIPARTVANYHRDAGAPIYAYEFQHPPSVLQKKRPSFAGSDHGDEVLFVFGFCFANGPIKIKGPVVHTKLGSLRGAFLTPKGKETVVSSYFGVPFAKPPMGPLRLAPPQPAEAWQGVRDATKQPPMCLQSKEILLDLLANLSMNVEVPEVSEDCLYLNIYTPSKPGDNRKLPVMVWIHGGGFSGASASIFDGHVLAAYQDVVVVLIQYRLGLLGFFSTGNEHAPGNYGLLDQVAALQWVQENIHSFGGDPGLVLSPLSSNLFRYAIAESGTAAMDSLMSFNPLPIAQEQPMLRFGVTIDGQFLPKPVDKLLQSQEFNKVPLINGVTDDDGGFMLINFLGPPGWIEGVDREQIIPVLPFFNPDFQDQAIAEFVLNEYMGTSNDRIEIREGFREIMGDFFFNVPARKIANYHRDAGAPVYMYEFQHPPSILQKKRPSFVGSDHGDEMYFVFGYCFGKGHVKLEGPVVQTKLGSLRGAFLTVKGKDTIVNSYLGVPFAKPPVGPLRLARPQPAEKWDGVRDATKQPPICLQDRQVSVVEHKIIGIDVEVPEVSEDCLYLNIYTPVKPGEDAKLPVMVWIHGGGLVLGSASLYDGSVLSAYQDVVVVLIQYRLGLLGFFSTGDEHAPGNYGFLDQIAALKWVQENIHSFGGDPGSVTIFGESAGGILSPLASGLFHRAIAESGTALWDGLVMTNPLRKAQNAAKLCKCDSSSSSKIVDCIMRMSDEKVLECSNQFVMLDFSLAMDSYFLPKPVMEIVKKQEFSKVPLITGITDDEFGYFLPEPRDRWIIDTVANEYLGVTSDPIKIRDIYREMMGDVMFNIPTLQLAKYHSASGAPVYLYEFQHPPSMIQKNRPSFVGVDHTDELLFIQGTCFAKAHLKAIAPFTKEEEELCRTVMAYWGNFARTGSPNGPGLTHWPEYEDETEYLGIGLKQKAGKNLKRKHYTFMTKTLPDLIRQGREKREHSEL
ncbi:fatty acyl- hydrolase medium chain-like isoform X4 [Labeo rohita]|uniref:Fatty acyl-hydrolase medium chain-like isoform X4 n=2 Tax=Labeonini TaxID=2743697 RepID=A0A498MTB8_LABRO|nr:fatty acyl- hydrolase medium chain-like isoform X4 [Labeo rohita]